jgi:glutaminyl-peptide cyclotransferase
MDDMSSSPSSSAGQSTTRQLPQRKKISGQTVFLSFVLCAGIGVAAYILFAETLGRASAAPTELKLATIPFDGTQAYAYLKQLCDFGPRPSGSQAIIAEQNFLIDYFQKLGATVSKQEFRARHPLTGEPVPMTNILVQWHPDRKERVLLCAHYDTRPYPDRDAKHPRGTFVGANDSAACVALLMELGKQMPQFQSRYGVDFLLVDGEDLVYWDQTAAKDTGNYCVGSEYFARQYATDPPAYKYIAAVVLDMIAGVNLRLPKEGFSELWVDSRPLTDQIWDTAGRLKVKEFIPKVWGQVTDDHVMLHDLGHIPACDIICDFGLSTSYPQWHTEADNPAHCSPLSLAKVGWVLQEWLKGLK